MYLIIRHYNTSTLNHASHTTMTELYRYTDTCTYMYFKPNEQACKLCFHEIRRHV